MKPWQSITGMLNVEITSPVPEQTLDRILLSGIPIYRVTQISELACTLLIHRRDFPKMEEILQKQGAALRVRYRTGLFWQVRSLFHRPFLLLGLAVLIASALYLPSRIFFVEVTGNSTVPTRQILAAAEDCGIRFLASRKTVRSEKMKNSLLSSIPQLQWAGINTSGCRAVITVRERKEDPNEDNARIVSNIIADRDGYILSGTILSGTPLFQPGDTVQKGQVLVSGYTDCGILIEAGRAQGDILAQTNRSLTAVTPSESRSRTQLREIKTRYSLLLGKKRINFWKYSRIPQGDCVRMYEEYYVTLPGGFQLPAAVCIDRYFCYETQSAVLPEADAQLLLAQFSDQYLKHRMIAGEILQTQQTMEVTEDLYALTGSYVCAEIIGREIREQIGDQNEQRD